jgi:acyl carrier protein
MAMQPGEGVETLLRFLGTQVPRRKTTDQVIISTYDLNHRINQWVERGRDNRDSGTHYDRPDLLTDYEAPRDPVEQALAGFYAETLGVNKIGIHDNFFELGGQSLQATDLAARVRAAFHIELPLRQFLEAPTVADLALVVAQSTAEKDSPAEPLVPIEATSPADTVSVQA